jgi:cation diffusion facilitator family transporter
VSEPRLKRSLRVTFIGMTLNAILAAIKLTAGILGNSYALIADATESLADIFSSIIVWRAVVVAAEPADADHPYGHGKAEPIAAALIAGILLVAAIGIGMQAIHETILPRQSPRAYTLLVLIMTVIIKEGMFRFGTRQALEIESSVVQTDAWHHRSDAITSLAAAVGISVALIGGRGFEKADSIAAIVAAMIIAWNGAQLLRNAVADLMDKAPGKNFEARIRQIAAETSGVDGVEKCMARKMGYEYLVDLHVEVNPQMTVQAGHDIAHQVKDKIREKLPNVRDVLVHVEPSGRKPRHSG